MDTFVPLEILKKGLTTLQNEVKDRKERIEADLSAKRPISMEDENWLDSEANLVDEVRLIEALESTPEYQKAFEKLAGAEKAIVRKLCTKAAGDTKGNKRKRM